MTNRRANYINMVDHLTDIPLTNIEKETNLTRESPYRQNFHIESESGSLGDPNGFSYFNKNYHLFYQWSPLEFSQNPHYTHHGWKHLCSPDLIHWQDLGAGMESDTRYDKYGTYSGSAFPVDDKLFIMYTGNTWVNTESDDDWQRIPYQIGAWMEANNKIKKVCTPFITGTLKGYTGHFRDPKVFKKHDKYYAVLGIQRNNQTGSAVLAESDDLHNWQILGEIKTNHNKFGYMWECPDYYELDDKGILAFCPQGLESEDNKFCNIYQSGYLIGKPLNMSDRNFVCGKFHELDKGFDFYAMQTTKDKKGRRILMAWMGLPEIVYPTVKYHYTGCMIFPRELKLENNVIVQQPVAEIKDLYSKKYQITASLNNKRIEIKAGKQNSRDIELAIVGHNDATILDLFANKNNSRHLRLIFNRKKQKFIVDRSCSGLEIASSYGTSRSCYLDQSKLIKVRILQDVSSAEIFLNNGKEVFSMRIFPDDMQNFIYLTSENGEAKIKATINQLKVSKVGMSLKDN
ncbi:beta-fructofuranosidase/PTS system sucrose-specific IIC component [Lactobacillus colini]|uniref:Sucrose-6-phosphate hydrolase n=1 Tax=Lactobacillus colini TaxID=1819254 RepID=A0ABS4ME33_9LACO|nr:sucrose-6-phosphate hydrolase [Lactobacillus colini]MBP2057945.1 beta-fructofuranosidase/PTS system sucrose-specific IIC component [Lactobacillus colini]